MKKRLPTGLLIVAIFQFVAPLVLPPASIASISLVLWLCIIGAFGLLGWNLLRLKAWSRIATIFVQGFSVLIHILILVGHIRVGTTPDTALNVSVIVSFAISIALSTAVLYYVDTPDIQVLMQ